MDIDRQKMFSPDRFELFTKSKLQNQQNSHIFFQKSYKLVQIQTPSDKNQSKQTLIQIIEKKDFQIRQLKKKLRFYESNLLQTRQKLQSTNYELQYFKKKICEQFSQSKRIQHETEIVNVKIVQMIQQLSCVKKLKNPIEIQNDFINQNEISKHIEKNLNSKNNQKIDQLCLQYLQKTVNKVANVIESAFLLKKVKKLKEVQGNS